MHKSLVFTHWQACGLLEAMDDSSFSSSDRKNYFGMQRNIRNSVGKVATQDLKNDR